MTEKSEMEALLRAAYRDFPGFDGSGDVSLETLDQHHRKVWENTLAYIHSEKAAAVTAALERAKEAIGDLYRPDDVRSDFGDGTSEAYEAVNDLISEASRSALCDRIAAAKEDGRAELRPVIDRFRHAVSWIAADSWDWTNETREMLESAMSFANSALGPITQDGLADIGAKAASAIQDARLLFAAQAREEGRKEGLREAEQYCTPLLEWISVMISRKMSTLRSVRKEKHIKDDSGEMRWIIESDVIFEIEAAALAVRLLLAIPDPAPSAAAAGKE